MMIKPNRTRPMVLIVDDDGVILRSLRIALARFFEVETSDSAVKGLAMMHSKQPDVVVLDIKMPDHDGFWLYKEIRKLNADVPIIFNSAYQESLGRDDVMVALKPFAYLPKSGNLGDFVELVGKAAEHYKRVTEGATAEATKPA